RAAAGGEPARATLELECDGRPAPDRIWIGERRQDPLGLGVDGLGCEPAPHSGLHADYRDVFAAKRLLDQRARRTHPRRRRECLRECVARWRREAFLRTQRVERTLWEVLELELELVVLKLVVRELVLAVWV